MNDIILKDEIKIENLVYEIRGVQVMIDSDLADLYQCKNGTKEINQAVKNNPDKFPERYCFRISEQEYNSLKSKFLTSKGGSRKGHNVFTEQGIAMLATILKTEVATAVSIKIMDAFVAMRHYLIENKDIYVALNNINNKFVEYDKKFDYLFSKFDHKEQIFLNSQDFDAYSSILDIFKMAKSELIIIDGYADETLLDMIKKINCKVILITKTKAKINKTDITKYNNQYHNLEIYYTDDFHDRYFIIDRKTFHLCGTSINYAGKKIFNINRIEDKIVKDTLLNHIIKIKS